MSIKLTSKIVLALSLSGITHSAFADGWDPISQAGAIGSIADTRHNLTMTYNSNGSIMNFARNNYGQICVYCHTPHGANSQINAPLWNRTVNPGNYTIYDKPTTLGLAGRMSLPGPGSLTCLSCHDGTIAIDSILNMPGSGGYGNNELGSADTAFLDTWVTDATKGTVGNHFELGPELGVGDVGTKCALCHSAAGSPVPDFRAFMLGTDLRNDHVIGVQFPTAFTAGVVDFNEPDVIIPGKWAYYDTNGDNIAQKNEVRLYDSGDGPEVECASCHDPHGVPSNGTGTRFNPSFLRVNNGISDTSGPGTTGLTSDGPSALCLTCHAK